MKRLLMVVVLWVFSAGICLAQQASGELQGFFQRVQPFKFRDPSIGLDMSGKSFNGGGFGFLLNITEKFGLYQQTGFFGGVGQDSLSLKMITEFQGMQVSKHFSKVDVFAKGGLGFARYVFNGAYIYYNMAFQYGGGVEIQLKPSLYLLLELTGLSTTLPNLSGSNDRSKWNTGFLIGPGIAIHF